VRERLIGALVPDALSPRGEGVSVPSSVLPAPRSLHDLTSAALLVSTARMDRSGRVHERILLRELGWDPGRRVDMDTLRGVILIAAAPAGQHGEHVVDHRGAIKIPAALRRLCGIEYGPPVVLVAFEMAQYRVRMANFYSEKTQGEAAAAYRLNARYWTEISTWLQTCSEIEQARHYLFEPDLLCTRTEPGRPDAAPR
jgi:hypothetical protein